MLPDRMPGAIAPQSVTRRRLLKAAPASGLLLVSSQSVRGSTANSAVRMGVLGCGGRASFVAPSFVENAGVRITALGDLFEDRVRSFKERIDKVSAKHDAPDVDAQQMFWGPSAYRRITESKEIDALLIATTPYYHPDHLDAAVTAGKHVYCEKPVATDVHGALRVIEIGRRAAGKVSIDIGFQIRAASAYRELAKRIHSGAVGEIACGDAHSCFPALRVPERPGISQTELKIREWFYDRTLSGDILVEQNVHAIDVCNWLLQGHPLKAVGTGGRKTPARSGENNWDHFNVIYTYPNNVSLSFTSTKLDKGWWDVTERLFGTKGVSESHYAGGVRIFGEQPWDSGFGKSGTFWQGLDVNPIGDALRDADANKEREFIESVVSGKFHNEALEGAESTLTAILGRTAAYKGGEMSWEEMIRSGAQWDPGIDLNRLAR